MHKKCIINTLYIIHYKMHYTTQKSTECLPVKVGSISRLESKKLPTLYAYHVYGSTISSTDGLTDSHLAIIAEYCNFSHL